jgi:hypothetical protein
MCVPFLGELPLDPLTRIGGDSGRPVSVAGDPAFRELAKTVLAALESSGGPKSPSISIED